MSNPIEASNFLSSCSTNIVFSANFSNISKEVQMRNSNRQASKNMYLEDNSPVFDGDKVV